MTEDQRESVPLISEHDTWISIDPILGCPANCRYCYLGPLALRGRKPAFRASVDELIQCVDNYLGSRNSSDTYRRLSRMPICFGNYTDTFMYGAGVDYFMKYATWHAKHLTTHPLCVVTKARLSYGDLTMLDQLGHKILVFLSQSFLNTQGVRRPELGPTSTPEETAGSLRLFRSLRNVRPVHFLRPVTRRSVPSLDAAVRLLTQMRDAGAVATVAVGLKLGAGVDLSADDADILLGEDISIAESAPEYFPAQARRNLLKAARIVGYPVYFNTSCAVALVTEGAEELGTWRVPMRWARCEPCNCPASQRARCDARRSSQTTPTGGELSNLTSRFDLPVGSLNWIESESAICLQSPVGQYTFNRLVHALPYRVVGRGVEPEEAWVGSFVREAELAVKPGSESPRATLPTGSVLPPFANDEQIDIPAEMKDLVERLRSITGFITTLHDISDVRPLVFGRYYHVRRVAWLASWLSDFQERAALNSSRVAWLAWAHDLNRWPFAHNSEKGRFDQTADLGRFIRATSLISSWESLGYRDDKSLLADLEGIVSKQISNLSPEAALVLLADVVSGFIEDPLLAITGIDLRLEMIPADVGRELAFPLQDREFAERLYGLNVLLYENRDVTRFVHEFDAIFQRCAVSFILAHSLTSEDALGRQSFSALRSRVKEGFLRATLFPYNNERISHGSRLRAELVNPLLGILGSDMARIFTTIHEDELLVMAVENELITADRCVNYIPELDYVMTHEPQNSFRNTYDR